MTSLVFQMMQRKKNLDSPGNKSNMRGWKSWSRAHLDSLVVLLSYLAEGAKRRESSFSEDEPTEMFLS